MVAFTPLPLVCFCASALCLPKKEGPTGDDPVGCSGASGGGGGAAGGSGGDAASTLDLHASGGIGGGSGGGGASSAFAITACPCSSTTGRGSRAKAVFVVLATVRLCEERLDRDRPRDVSTNSKRLSGGSSSGSNAISLGGSGATSTKIGHAMLSSSVSDGGKVVFGEHCCDEGLCGLRRVGDGTGGSQACSGSILASDEWLSLIACSTFLWKSPTRVGAVGGEMLRSGMLPWR